jgi:CubicO group peptidase (beta-lactamase class C family)
VITKNQIMRLVSRQKELNFKPGDEYAYCNTGFTLMAEIVSRVSGEPFPVWMEKNVFVPLEMKSTLFYDDHEKIVKNRAYSYHENSDQVMKKSVLNYANVGATSLFTTVEDLSLWAANYDKTKVGNERVMEMTNQRFVLTKGDTIPYAFGQVLGKYKGLPTAAHGGADAGYRTTLLRFPEQHLSVSVFSNLASSNPGLIAYELADIFLSKEFKIEKEKKDDKPSSNPPAEAKFDATGIRLSDFTGTYYSSELDTRYKMVIQKDTLIAQHQRHDDLKLSPTAKDAFNCNILGKVEFTRNKANQVTGLKATTGRVRNLVFVRD